MTKHAIKFESLDMTKELADQYEQVIREFLEQLEFSDDRIQPFESRRRDGFIPHGYNYGGLQGIAYISQYTATIDPTGFENTDELLEKTQEYYLACWLTDNNLTKEHELTDAQYEELHKYSMESDDTIQFQARVMMTSETTANVDFYVSASDSPYHRRSDDKLELNISFKSPKGMKQKLNRILKHSFVENLRCNIRDSY